MSANRAAMALPPPPPAAAAPAAAPAVGFRSCSSEPGGGGGGGGGGPPGFLPAAAAAGAAAGAAGAAAAAPPPAAAAPAPGLNCDTGMPLAFQVGPAGKCRAQKACRQAGQAGMVHVVAAQAGRIVSTGGTACNTNPAAVLHAPTPHKRKPAATQIGTHACRIVQVTAQRLAHLEGLQQLLHSGHPSHVVGVLCPPLHKHLPTQQATKLHYQAVG